MRKRSKLPKPTEGELELLQVLWERGPSTVRKIHEGLSGDRGTGYTTTLKVLQKMMNKGLVQRDESSRTHVYTAVAKAEQTRSQLASDLAQKGFGGSTARLAVAALNAKPASKEELNEIRQEATEVFAARAEVEAEITNEEISDLYAKLYNRYGDSSIVSAYDGICSGCHIKLNPQTVNMLRHGSEIVMCKNCSRLMYL